MKNISLTEIQTERAALLAPAIRMLTGIYDADRNSVDSTVVFAPVIPDGLSDSVFVSDFSEIEDQYADIENKINAFKSENGCAPAFVVVENLGVYSCSDTKQNADKQLSAFEKCERDGFTGGRIADKIVIVTGGAQGFGEGIARKLLDEGAYIAIADLNEELANAKAKEICDIYGSGRAIAVKTDVSDEDSVKNMVYSTVLNYGGLDCIISNAGIARSGNIEEMTKKFFELSMSINYTGYFLCSRFASRIMKIQFRFCKDYFADIVQVNSKSGLVGSNKNFAYAGSKFGGIGLTQSFALELVDYNIKVNSVCPGNFFDGPLWSDPEKGLFKLYLESGKVPGAKNVDDVKKAYLSKIPMKKGCLPSDVAKAIIYCMEQLYETGQAIPVTGGQVMLK